MCRKGTVNAGGRPAHTLAVKTGHVNSCRKKFSAASAKVVRGIRAPSDFLRAAIDMHSSRCGPRQLALHESRCSSIERDAELAVLKR